VRPPWGRGRAPTTLPEVRVVCFPSVWSWPTLDVMAAVAPMTHIGATVATIGGGVVGQRPTVLALGGQGGTPLQVTKMKFWYNLLYHKNIGMLPRSIAMFLGDINVAHLQKHSRAATGHLCAHYDRSADNIGNKDIDPERSGLNYNLGPSRDGRQVDYIRQRCGEVKCHNRKDVNVLCTWVVTAPKGLPEADQGKFFQEAYGFMAGRYGGNKNVVSAYVHMDEVTPHMHFAFVPVVDGRDGQKVSAKEVVNRRDLQTFHADLSRHMAAAFGRDVGILNEATADGNRTVAEMKKQSAAIDVEREALAAKMERLRADKLKYEGAEKTLKQKASQLRQEETRLEKKAKELTSATDMTNDIEVIHKRRGGTILEKITLSKKDYQTLYDTARKSASNAETARSYKQAQGRISELEKRVDELKPSLAERLHYGQLEVENRNLKKQLAAAVDVVERHGLTSELAAVPTHPKRVNTSELS
jgi:hypothetical protein